MDKFIYKFLGSREWLRFVEALVFTIYKATTLNSFITTFLLELSNLINRIHLKKN